MELLERIFAALDFTNHQKEQARKDFDVLVKAKTVEQLVSELPQDKRASLTKDNAGDVLKDFYSAEVINERTTENLKVALKEYVDFFLQNGSDQEKQAITKVLQEAIS